MSTNAKAQAIPVAAGATINRKPATDEVVGVIVAAIFLIVSFDFNLVDKVSYIFFSFMIFVYEEGNLNVNVIIRVIETIHICYFVF